jgi:hypothetical protein
MENLDVRSWLNLPSGCNDEEMEHAPSLAQRVMACIYHDALTHHTAENVVIHKGQPIAIAMHLHRGSLRITRQIDIAERLKVDRAHVSKAIRELVARGRICVINDEHTRRGRPGFKLGLLPQPDPGIVAVTATIPTERIQSDSPVEIWYQGEVERFDEGHKREHAEFMKAWRERRRTFLAGLDKLRDERLHSENLAQPAGDSQDDDNGIEAVTRNKSAGVAARTGNTKATVTGNSHHIKQKPCKKTAPSAGGRAFSGPASQPGGGQIEELGRVLGEQFTRRFGAAPSPEMVQRIHEAKDGAPIEQLVRLLHNKKHVRTWGGVVLLAGDAARSKDQWRTGSGPSEQGQKRDIRQELLDEQNG